MNLTEALRQVAADTGLDAAALAARAAEDHETGWDDNAGDWPIGSLYADEGRALYALIRVLRPSVIVEFGAMYGCSSKHILMALVNNERGTLFSVDPEPRILTDHFTIAERSRWKVIRGMGETATLPPRADVVFEDAGHDAPGTEALIRRALALEPALVLSHDAEHFVVGEAVRAGFAAATGVNPPRTVKVDGAACGFAYHWAQPNIPTRRR